MWGAISGIASIAALAFAPGFFPDWYYVLVSVGYGLLLPIVAVLHVRHRSVRESGAVLGTAAGTAAIVIGIAAAATPDLVVAALFVRGVWWWTVGKMWWETGVINRGLGVATMALAAIALAIALATAAVPVGTDTLRLAERPVLGAWTLAVALALWRTRG